MNLYIHIKPIVFSAEESYLRMVEYGQLCYMMLGVYVMCECVCVCVCVCVSSQE